MKSDPHSRVLWWGFKAPDFFLMRGIRKIENDEAVAAKSPVPAISPILQSFRHIDWTMQAGKRRLVCKYFRWNKFGPNPFVVLGLFAFARAGNPPHGDLFDVRGIGSIDDHISVHELPEIRWLVNESFVRRGIEIGVFASIIIIAVRTLTRGAGAELRQLDDFRGIGHVIETNPAKSFIIFSLSIKGRVVIFAHRRFRRRVRNRRLRPSHQNPLFEFFVERDLDLVALKPALVVDVRLAHVADVDHVALMKTVAPVANGHELHLAVANMARLEVREYLHVVDVHPAVEVREAVGSRMAMVVSPSG